MRRLPQLWKLFLLVFLCAASPGAAQKPDPAVVYANSIRHGRIAYREGWFGRGDARLHYVEAGRGPLILLYHGFPSFWYCWFDEMEALKARYHVVAVDGLGAGRSAKPTATDAYRIEKLAAQIDGLARHVNGYRRFTLIGHDWGAALAFAYAQAYPARLNAVIGMGAPPYNLFLDLVRNDPEQQSRSRYMQLFRSVTLDALRSGDATAQIWQQSYRGLLAKNELDPQEGALFRNALSDPRAIYGGMSWYRANVPAFDAITAKDYWPAGKAKIAVPALMIWGDADMTFVDRFLPRLAEYAPAVRIVRLPGAGHWTPMEQPIAVNAAIAQFLGDVESQARKPH